MDYIKAKQILGLTGKINEKELKKRYRVLAKKYHPDTNKKETQDKFILINDAYTYLMEKGLGVEVVTHIDLFNFKVQ